MARYFSDAFLQEVTSATDIVDYVGSYVRLKRTGSDYVGLCPFHGEKTPSFHVNAQKQLYHCFGCGAGGTVIQFAMQAENLDFQDAVKKLAERAHLHVPENDGQASKAYYEKKDKIYAMNADAARFFHETLMRPEGEKGLAYFKERGLDRKWLIRFGLGYDPGGTALIDHLTQKGYSKDLMMEAGLLTVNQKGKTYDKFWDRVIFPIIDVRGNVIGFGGRVLTDAKPKYLNSPDSVVFNKGKNLYALNFAKNAKDSLIFAEGYMDVIALHRFGITSAVASLGTALTPQQAALAARYVKTVYLCYDTDEAGQKATQRAIDIFSAENVKIRIIVLPSSKDPDEFLKEKGVEHFRLAMKQAVSPVQYRLDRMKTRYDLDKVDEKVEFLTEAANLLATLENAIEREEYSKMLAESIHISPEAVYTQIQKQQKANAKSKAWQRPKIASTVEIKQEASSEQPKTTVKVKRTVYEAEGLILSLLSSDHRLIGKLGDKINVELFSEGLSKRVAGMILTPDGDIPETKDIILKMPEEDIAACTELLSFGGAVSDPKKAIEDAIRLLEEEQHKVAYRRAIDAGDIKRANELLKQMKNR